MKKPIWSVQEKRDGRGRLEDGCQIELSVIHKDNELGRASWGWGGADKIIILEDAIEDKAGLTFARKCAKILCAGLNKSAKLKLCPIKSKIIGMLHDLKNDTGDNRLRSGEYMSDEVDKIIIEAGKLPDLEEEE